MHDTPGLTRAIARGDADAFTMLYRAWFERVYALAKSASGRDEAFCLDVVQEVMMRVARRVPVLPDERALSAWLGTTTVRVSISQLRREQRQRARERGAAKHERAAGADGLDGDERARALEALLSVCKDEEYELMVARLARGLTLEQAGRAAGMSPGAAHGRVRRMVERMRDAWKEYRL